MRFRGYRPPRNPLPLDPGWYDPNNRPPLARKPWGRVPVMSDGRAPVMDYHPGYRGYGRFTRIGWPGHYAPFPKTPKHGPYGGYGAPPEGTAPIETEGSTPMALVVGGLGFFGTALATNIVGALLEGEMPGPAEAFLKGLPGGAVGGTLAYLLYKAKKARCPECPPCEPSAPPPMPEEQVPEQEVMPLERVERVHPRVQAGATCPEGSVWDEERGICVPASGELI